MRERLVDAHGMWYDLRKETKEEMNMKKIMAMLMMLMMLCSVAFAEALPVESAPPAVEELNAGMTFEDVADVEVLVAGPKTSRQFIENYVRENPDVIWDIPEYLFMYDLVRSFTDRFPDAENYNTYTVTEDSYTVAEMSAGYCITFHQNLASDDPFGGYTPFEYAAMIAISMRELDAEGVYVGFFGNPEISFLCMDKEKALRFAVQHNQNSIYCVSTDETPENPKWDGSTNPIRGIE